MIINLTSEEREELEELRLYKLEHESKALNKAFFRLESLLNSHHDAVISVRAFRVLADCLIALKEEIKK